eukprot:2822824-Alexandrium_andersonii.AAC.1
MADSTHGHGQTPSTSHRAPSEPSPNERCTIGEDASTQQLGAPRSGAPSRSVGALSPTVRR